MALAVRGVRVFPISELHSELAPVQLLAAAIIRQALLDAHSPAVSERVRKQAMYFLSHSTGLQFWCAVAGLGVDILWDRVRRGDRACEHITIVDREE